MKEIPGIVLDEGLDWQWQSFPDYLDRRAARSYTMDIASHVTHAPLRVFVTAIARCATKWRHPTT